MEDQTSSPDQLREAFRGIAKDKVCNAFLTTCERETKKIKFPHSHS